MVPIRMSRKSNESKAWILTFHKKDSLRKLPRFPPRDFLLASQRRPFLQRHFWPKISPIAFSNRRLYDHIWRKQSESSERTNKLEGWTRIVSGGERNWTTYLPRPLSPKTAKNTNKLPYISILAGTSASKSYRKGFLSLNSPPKSGTGPLFSGETRNSMNTSIKSNPVDYWRLKKTCRIKRKARSLNWGRATELLRRE